MAVGCRVCSQVWMSVENRRIRFFLLLSVSCASSSYSGEGLPVQARNTRWRAEEETLGSSSAKPGGKKPRFCFVYYLLNKTVFLFITALLPSG